MASISLQHMKPNHTDVTRPQGSNLRTRSPLSFLTSSSSSSSSNLDLVRSSLLHLLCPTRQHPMPTRMALGSSHPDRPRPNKYNRHQTPSSHWRHQQSQTRTSRHAKFGVFSGATRFWTFPRPWSSPEMQARHSCPILLLDRHPCFWLMTIWARPQHYRPGRTLKV